MRLTRWSAPAVHDRLLGIMRLLHRQIRRQRDERADGVVERLGAGDVVLREFHRRERAVADRLGLLECGEVMEGSHATTLGSVPGTRPTP